MRITLVVGRYWPATGGVETFARHVAGELAKRHEVTVVANRINDDPDTLLNGSLRHPPPFEPFRDRRVLVVPIALHARHRLALTPLAAQVVPGLRRYAFGPMRVPMMALYAAVVGPLLKNHVHAADVVHAWTAGFLGAAAIRSARVAGVPSVITPFVHPGQWGDDLASRRLLKRADRVVGLLGYEDQMLQGLGVASDRIDICGVCAGEMPTRDNGDLRRRHAITGPLVLFLGARRAYKGHDLLLSVADRVASQRPGTTFAFVGPGAALHRDHRVARVLDIGLVSDTERAAWLDAADLLCLPSRHEIFPVSVLEAWSAGTPVLVTDLPPLVELMHLSGGGRTVRRDPDALASALADLLADPAELRRLGNSGQAFWREGRTPEAAAACHERIYDAAGRMRDSAASKSGPASARSSR